MKKKRTAHHKHRHSDDPLADQPVAVHNMIQVEQSLLELDWLKHQTFAMEADVYKSMSQVCTAANRFLAPRRARVQALLAGLLAFEEARRRGFPATTAAAPREGGAPVPQRHHANKADGEKRLRPALFGSGEEEV
ncbi:MAG: hypothetical protein HQL88_09915 [Magnetococcales bacterium]|nr:hypothetical protein [Magnetococcales bacterium]